jgi:FkbM family methyltransferase
MENRELIDNLICSLNKLKDITVNNILIVGCRDLYEIDYFFKKYPNSKIYAFEPNENQYNLCKSQNTHDNLILFKTALSNENCKRKFYITPGNIGASSLHFPTTIPHSASNSIIETIVDCTSYNFLYKNNEIQIPDILGMDVQGHELEVLKGMGDVLKNVKVIHSELCLSPYYDGQSTKDDIINYLSDFNFKLDLEIYDWEKESNGIFINKDFIC